MATTPDLGALRGETHASNASPRRERDLPKASTPSLDHLGAQMAVLTDAGAAAPKQPLVERRDQNSLLCAWTVQYRNVLLRYFRRRVSCYSDCEDLVQEVFLRLTKCKSLDCVQFAEGYLFKVASNTLSDWRRARLSSSVCEQSPAEDIPDETPSPQQIVLSRDAVQKMMGHIRTLPRRTQLVFMMYHFEQRPHSEIAKRVGVAVRTVEDHMARANASLIRALADERR